MYLENMDKVSGMCRFEKDLQSEFHSGNKNQLGIVDLAILNLLLSMQILEGILLELLFQIQGKYIHEGIKYILAYLFVH